MTQVSQLFVELSGRSLYPTLQEIPSTLPPATIPDIPSAIDRMGDDDDDDDDDENDASTQTTDKFNFAYEFNIHAGIS